MPWAGSESGWHERTSEHTHPHHHLRRLDLGRFHRERPRARFPHLVLVPLDETLADQAADAAAQHRLRGSDAVYAAVALRFGSTLVTLDREQRERVADVIPARLPAEALAEWTA